MTVRDSIAMDGFAVVQGVLSPAECEELIEQLGPVERAGRRGLLKDPTVSALALSPPILNLLQPHLLQSATPVRGIYFDKSPTSNWLVAWHQDLTLAVQEEVEVPGFGPWSIKEGVPHVQPPVGLLEHMLTARIHLDACDGQNGALRVIPGSHLWGRLEQQKIEVVRAENTEVVCEAAAGDVLLMRPLLLHASSRTLIPAHRRVIHLEYAGFKLPEPLRWAEGCSPLLE